jgi:DNA-binding NarL/FixJ family response regulator
MDEAQSQSMPDRVRLLVADDHEEFLTSLTRTLSASDRLQIVATAAFGERAVELAAELRPDVAILDVRMPGLGGMEAISRIHRVAPGTAVIMLSLSCEREYIRRAFEARAVGYVSKIDVTDQIVAAVDAVLMGEHFISSSALRELRTTSTRLQSPESRRELLDAIDREGIALLHLARAIAPSEESAKRALVLSFSAYAMARDFSEEIQSVRTWLLVSVAMYLFGSRPTSDNGARDAVISITGSFERWHRFTSNSHRNHGDFARYWNGSMSPSARRSLWAHLDCCRSCHLQWSLMGYLDQATKVKGDNLSAPALSGVRDLLLSDIQAGHVEKFLIALADRTARLQQLVASEIELLLGAGAAEGWKLTDHASGGRAGSVAGWAAEFLGGRTTPFFAAGFRNARSPW